METTTTTATTPAATPATAPLRTVLHTYMFDTDNPAELAQWEELKRKLRNGPRSMCSHGGALHVTAALELGAQRSDTGTESITVELDPGNLFCDQWNATGPNGKSYRVFDWAIDSAYAFDPKGKSKRKQGHWLEQTPEMIELRATTFACGYCGHKEHVSTAGAFCSRCLTKGSEHLRPDELHLLRMLPVRDSFGATRAPLTEAERAEIMPAYVKAQLSRPDPGRSFRAIQDGIAAAHKDMARAFKTLQGWEYLEKHPEIPTRNMICYPPAANRPLFTWGYSGDGMPLEAATELAKLLADFPATWEIRTGKGKNDCITGGVI